MVEFYWCLPPENRIPDMLGQGVPCGWLLLTPKKPKLKRKHQPWGWRNLWPISSIKQYLSIFVVFLVVGHHQG